MTTYEQQQLALPMNCSDAIHFSFDLFRMTAKGMDLAVFFGEDGYISEVTRRKDDDPDFEQYGDEVHHLFTVEQTDELREMCIEAKVAQFR